jgi:hypothetical protein
MKRSIVICLAVFFLSVAASVKSNKPNFGGIWNQDPLLSNLVPASKGDESGSALLNNIGIIGSDMTTIPNPAVTAIGLFGSVLGMAGQLARSGQGVRGAVPTINLFTDLSISPLMSTALDIEQTKSEITITHKGANGSQDFVETFALNGKEKVETVTFSSGGNLKRISKVKLGKDNLKIETRVIIPGGDFITGNREFTLVEKANAMLVKISIRGRLYSPPNQKLYYNKRK